MKALFTIVRILFLVLNVAMLSVTIYLLTQHLWGPAVASACLVAILAIFNVRDIMKMAADAEN